MKYENKEICSNCGGNCCKRYAGATLPREWGKNIKENIINALKSGNWTIDAQGSLYYIRPAHKGINKMLDIYSYDIGCIFLTENGCKLNYKQRPTGCKLLEPKNENNCVAYMEDWKMAKRWLNYQNMIEEIIQELDINEITLTLNSKEIGYFKGNKFSNVSDSKVKITEVKEGYSIKSLNGVAPKVLHISEKYIIADGINN